MQDPRLLLLKDSLGFERAIWIIDVHVDDQLAIVGQGPLARKPISRMVAAAIVILRVIVFSPCGHRLTLFLKPEGSECCLILDQNVITKHNRMGPGRALGYGVLCRGRKFLSCGGQHNQLGVVG